MSLDIEATKNVYMLSVFFVFVAFFSYRLSTSTILLIECVFLATQII